ncbi:MAG: IclR family transcriptional regulator [Acetobacteraceae bacterium]
MPRRRGRPSAAERAGQEGDGVNEHRVEAVERALSILAAFIDNRPALTLAEIAERTGLYPSTILRLAGSLARFGYLHRGSDGSFRLGPTPMQLGALYRESFRLTDYVRPVLALLVERTEQTAAFYIRDGARRICLYRHHTRRMIRHHIDEGTELPLHLGASAHVLMAFTDGDKDRYATVRRLGYAISLGERDPETAAIAAPVFGADGRLVGALSVTGLASRFQAGDTQPMVEAVVELAQKLTQELGGIWEGRGIGGAEWPPGLCLRLRDAQQVAGRGDEADNGGDEQGGDEGVRGLDDPARHPRRERAAEIAVAVHQATERGDGVLRRGDGNHGP